MSRQIYKVLGLKIKGNALPLNLLVVSTFSFYFPVIKLCRNGIWEASAHLISINLLK